MSGQVMLTDDELREHLARRAGSGAAEGETGNVLAALDAVPVRGGVRFVAFPVATRRRAIGSTLVALAAVLALVFVALPALRPQSTGHPPIYPDERPLTADELARVMAAGLPQYTTVVANVTIGSSSGSCAGDFAYADRYAYRADIEGADPAICMVSRSQPPSKGILAFRVLDPGVLGFLTEVRTAGSQFAYTTLSDWPDEPFLFDGWLGGTELLASCARTPASPDPLDPVGDGDNCPYVDWLASKGDDPHFFESGPNVVDSTSWARLVNAQPYYVYPPGQAPVTDYPWPRHATPELGVYLVLPTAPSGDMVGWIVVARVDTLTIPQELSAYPASRSLTTDELARLMASSSLANATIVVDGTIDTGRMYLRNPCPMDRYPMMGVLTGTSPDVCVMAPDLSGVPSTKSGEITGTFALRYLSPGYLGYLGQITSPTASGHTFKVTDEWPLEGKTFLVDGWLGSTANANWPCTATATAPIDPLNPMAFSDCPYTSWLADNTGPGPAPLPLPSADLLGVHASGSSGSSRYVEATAARQLAGLWSLGGPAVEGTYVVRSITEACPGQPEVSSIGCGAWLIVGKVDPVTLTAPRSPTATTTPTVTPVVSPSPSWPSLPTPTPLPQNSPIAPVPPALIQAGDAPFTFDQFLTAVRADPVGMDGKTVIVQAALEPGCHPILYPPNARQPICAETAPTNPDDVWAVRDEAGMLDVVAKISRPEGPPITSLAGAVKSTTTKDGTYFLVDAWLNWMPSPCDTPPYPSGSLCGAGAVASYLTVEPGTSHFPPTLMVGLGDYQKFGSFDLNASAVHGLFLVAIVTGNDCASATGDGQDQPGEVCGTSGWIVARVEPG